MQRNNSTEFHIQLIKAMTRSLKLVWTIANVCGTSRKEKNQTR